MRRAYMLHGMRAVSDLAEDGTVTPCNGGMRLVLDDANEIAARWDRSGACGGHLHREPAVSTFPMDPHAKPPLLPTARVSPAKPA